MRSNFHVRPVQRAMEILIPDCTPVRRVNCRTWDQASIDKINCLLEFASSRDPLARFGQFKCPPRTAKGFLSTCSIEEYLQLTDIPSHLCMLSNTPSHFIDRPRCPRTVPDIWTPALYVGLTPRNEMQTDFRRLIQIQIHTIRKASQCRRLVGALKNGNRIIGRFAMVAFPNSGTGTS